LADGRCGKDRAIAAAAADDHVGTVVEKLDVGMDTGHRDHALGRVQRGEIERRPRVEPCYRIACLNTPP
jgi:peptide subunit release factor RF-3